MEKVAAACVLKLIFAMETNVDLIVAGENGLPKQDIDNNWGCPEVPVSGDFQ